MARPQNPEEILLRAESQAELKDAERSLYEVLVPENREKALKLENFVGRHYSQEAISADQEYVAKMEKLFQEYPPEEKARHMRGELFEAIVDSQIDDSDWMGSRASVTVPSRFDDIKHGIDGIVNFEREEGGTSHLALAVDVTDSKIKMDEKFNGIMGSIKSGSLSKVEYFRSDNFEGRLFNVPRIVIGAGRETVNDISEILLSFRRLRATVAASHRPGQEPTEAERRTAQNLADIRKRLAAHPLQGMILVEAKTQLEAFRKYALEIGKTTTAGYYTEVLTLIDNVIEQKGKEAAVPDEAAEDPIYQMILDKAARFGEKPEAE